MPKLLTGGSGLLGRHLLGSTLAWQPGSIHAPSSAEFDVRKARRRDVPSDVEYIIHAAAYTDVAKAEIERDHCWEVNAAGTKRICDMGLPVAYISTEYVFDGELGGYREVDQPHPLNWYAMTKWSGEWHALDHPGNLVIRCLFKPRPFEHPRACTDQWTSGDYVERMAGRIARAIGLWREGKVAGLLHLGRPERISTFDLAKESRPDVEPCLREDLPVRLPRDTSLDTTKWRSLTS